MHLSAASGQHELCALLLKHGANVHLKNHKGHTAAHTAVHWAQSQCLVEILRTVDDLDAVNKQGENLKDMADRLGYTRLRKLLDNLDTTLDAKERSTSVRSLAVAPVNSAAMDTVTINVSGRTFVASRSTLEVIYGSYFWMMLNPGCHVPDDDPTNQPGFGTGPGKELGRISDVEFELKRDPVVFSHVLDLLRGMKYANLKSALCGSNPLVKVVV